MLFSLVYFIVRSILGTARRQDDGREIELLVLRHQVRVLQRQVKRPRLHRLDRLLLAAASKVMPRDKWSSFIVRPETLLRWHRELVRRKWTYKRSGRPGRPPIEHGVRDLIVRLGRENPRWGYQRIRGELLKLGIRVSATMVRTILQRYGLHPAPRRVGPTWTEFLRSQAEGILATDFFTVETVFLKTLVFKATDVVASFHRAAAAHGFPASLLTDNGAVFTAAPRGGRCAIELETARLGIRSVHSRPYHPQTCGKVERLHQTLKRFLARQQPGATIAELQAHLDRFRDYYNTVRPHRAIGRRTPAEAFGSRPKATPSLASLAVPGRFRLRRDKVDITGVVTLRHNSRLHHIGLGRKLIGTRVLVLVDGLQVRVITEDGELLRELILDPSRD